MSAKNNLIVENLQLLDNALDYLIKSKTLSLHIDDFRIKLLKDTDKKLVLKNSDNNSIEALFDDIFTDHSQKTKNLVKVSEVLLFLESEKLIRLIEQNHIRITFQGIIQHSKGFIKQYRFEKHKSILDVYNIYITIVLTLISLIAGYLIGQ